MSEIATPDALTSQLSSVKILLHPELLAAAMKAKELDVFMLWWIARTVKGSTQLAQKGDGLIHADTLLKLATKVLQVRQASAYLKINKGIGIYWTKPGGKKGSRKTGLMSLKKICDRLCPNMSPSKPFCLTLGEIEERAITNGWTDVKSFLMSMVAARHGGQRLVSRDVLKDQTGVSGSTLRRYFKASESLHVSKHFAKIYGDENRRRVELVCQIMTKEARVDNIYARPFRIFTHRGMHYIVRQLPNSYALTEYAQSSYKARPRELRQMDSQNREHYEGEKYLSEEKNPKKGVGVAAESYKFLGYVKETELGPIHLWEARGAEIAPEIINDPPTRSLAAWWKHQKEWLRLEKEAQFA